MNPHYSEIARRANHHCEYCQAPEVVFNFPFEVEHIIPICKNGTNDPSNLALSCRFCNLHKGIQISGKLADTEQTIRFFHPRIDQWKNHFKANQETGEIIGLTSIGSVTIIGLKMNGKTQIYARKLWISLGLFPS